MRGGGGDSDSELEGVDDSNFALTLDGADSELQFQLDPVDRLNDTREVLQTFCNDEETALSEEPSFYDDLPKDSGSDRDSHSRGTIGSNSPCLDSGPEMARLLVEYHPHLTGSYILSVFISLARIGVDVMNGSPTVRQRRRLS